MQIFKWMPIRAEEQQQTVVDNIEQKSHHQEPMREILTTNIEQISDVEQTKISVSGESTHYDKMILNGNQATNVSHSTNDEQNRVCHNTLSNGNYSIMHQKQEQTNKRKLDEVDSASSDSCGSSSSDINDLDRNSDLNPSMTGLQNITKRQKTSSHPESGTDPDPRKTGVDGASVQTTTENTNSPGTLRQTIERTTALSTTASETFQGQSTDEEMALDDEPVIETAPNPQSRKDFSSSPSVTMVDSNEDLSNIARLVTEQIVTRVSDCYMDI